MASTSAASKIEHKSWRVVAAIIWSLIALLVVRTVLFFPGAPSLDWPTVLRRFALDWIVWLAIAPAVVFIARRVEFTSGWTRALLVHVAAAVAIGILHAFVRRLFGSIMPGVPRETWAALLYTQAHLNFLTYFGIVAVTRLHDDHRDARNHKRFAAELQRELVKARLQALRAQLQPHFLFNTMNAISALMHDDVERADRMLGRLGDLLRASLHEPADALIPLERELEVVRLYVGIQEDRFGAALKVAFSVTEEAAKILVPPLLLQPIVENAIEHGISSDPGSGAVGIFANVVADTLVIRVVNDRPSDAVSRESGAAIGLENTRKRLQQIYGSAATFELVIQDRKATARISIPVKHDQRFDRG
jgi:two-component system, LytTR family, sensor kinase